MIYLDYISNKECYLEAQSVYNEILQEKEELFKMTQPKSVCYNNNKTKSSKQINLFDAYLLRKEELQIDKRLFEAKAILEDRQYMLQQKEIELRKSKDVDDLIYLYKYIDGLHTSRIARKLNYSVSQIYRHIASIKDAIECEKNCDKI